MAKKRRPSKPAKGLARHKLGAIVEVLSQRITDRVLAPGSRLIEQEICDEFGVVRTTAREVLTALQQRGLVERPPNRSAIVVGLGFEDIKEILVIREVLDALCIRLATENSAPTDWQDLIDLIDGPMRLAVKRGDWGAYLGHLEPFYVRTREACASRRLRETLRGIDDRSKYVNRRLALLPGRLQAAWQELRGVVQAMRAGNACEAERLRRESIRNQRDFYITYAQMIGDI
ncbi:MAG: GntR family transcriptional regulator [Proteobacteria bacterium]|nr:GntR family transcriptional regulator [Pseudomonadota bacterium]